MVSPTPIGLLWELGLIIVVATIFNFIARRLKQPPLVGYIVAGTVVSPYFLELLSKYFYIDLTFLHVANIDNITMLSQLGVAFLLFSVGIESDFLKLKNFGKLAILGGSLQVALTALFTFLLSNWFAVLSFQEALYLSIILSFSSTMIVVKLLSDSFTIDTVHGRIMLGFLLVQDVLVILLMPVLGNLALLTNVGVFANFVILGGSLIAFALMLSKFLYPKIFSKSVKNPEVLFLGSLSICFVFMFLAESIGIPMAIGAFIAGLSLSMLPYSFEIYDEIRGVRDFFVTIFFVTLGMQFNLFQLSGNLNILLISFVIVFLIKPAIFYILCLLAGYGKEISLMVALGLSQVSEFSFLLAGQGLSTNVLSQSFYSTTIFVIGLSMVITPYFFRYRASFAELSEKLAGFLPKRLMRDLFRRRIKQLEEPTELAADLVIVGGGIMGGSIARFIRNEKLLIVDHDPDVIETLRREGFVAIYGEAENKTLWRKLNLKEVKMLILAIPKFDATMRLLQYAKQVNPDIVVFARAHSFEEARELYRSGADFVCIPEAAGSNILVKEIVEYLSTGSLTRVKALRDELLKHLEEAAKKHPKKKPFNHKIRFI
jgi:Kef-type K+ transport system membrane component KefB/Trk K+ transport system NAD-binding subunit